MTSPGIHVDGLKEFVRDLKKLDADLPKMARLAGNEAAQRVVDYAKPLIPRGPGAGGHVRNTLRTRSTRTAARVSAGNRKMPYYGWLDFGGRVGKGRSVRRPFMQEGRYIWAQYAEHSDEVYAIYVRELLTVARAAGIDMENG